MKTLFTFRRSVRVQMISSLINSISERYIKKIFKLFSTEW